MGCKFQSTLVVALLSTLCHAEPPLGQQPFQQLTQPNPLGTRYSASTDVSHVAYKSPLLTLGSLEEVHLPAAPLIDDKGALRNDLKFGDDIQRYGKLNFNTGQEDNQINSKTLTTVSKHVESSQPSSQPQQAQITQQPLNQQQLNNQIYQLNRQQLQQYNELQQLSQLQQQNEIQANQLQEIRQQQYKPIQLDQFQQYNQIQQQNQLNQLQQLSDLQNGQQFQQFATYQPQIEQNQQQQYNQLSQQGEHYSVLGQQNQFQYYNALQQPQIQQYNEFSQPILNQQFGHQSNSAVKPKVRVAFTNGLSNFNYGF